MHSSLLPFFKLTEILNDEPEKCRITLLGTLPASWATTNVKEEIIATDSDERLPAIIRLEKTAFAATLANDFFHPEEGTSLVKKVQVMESTDIYTWFAGWISSSISETKQPQGDVKINIVCPATEVHIRKYKRQQSILVQETPELYNNIIKPYISSIPLSRTKWVTDILNGHSEQDKILFTSSDFIILPDMKWDLHTIGSLYLVAISRDPNLHCLRDLRASHIPFLKRIKSEAYMIVGEKWGIEKGGLRMYIHYQPSYYHFHVHIVNANYQDSGMGMMAGQAHLLEDVISLLELNDRTFELMTITYGLGDQHPLYEPMKAAHS